ncbi:MAG: hypothetical protein PHQ43_00210 [Dehalococcoidales bacterium]|nr:hypothetical protein [Dehalococcoidales bacterium]
MGWITHWTEGLQGSPTNMGYTGIFVDTKANFPAASADFQGALAWASDEQKLYYCSSAPAWVAIAPGLNIAQTIYGVQTFDSIPVGPASDPTTANQLVRKSYADGGKNLASALSGSWVNGQVHAANYDYLALTSGKGILKVVITGDGTATEVIGIQADGGLIYSCPSNAAATHYVIFNNSVRIYQVSSSSNPCSAGTYEGNYGA